MLKSCFSFLLLAWLLGLVACTTNVRVENAPNITKLTPQGSSTHTVSAHKIGLISFYSSSSFFSGSPLLKKDPKTETAQAETGDVKLTILAEGFAGSSERAQRLRDNLQKFSERFTRSLAEQRQITWKNQSKRKFDFRLYYIHWKLGISRRNIRPLFGKTFHLSFYKSISKGMAATRTASILAHESYHLEISKIGSRFPAKEKIKTSPALFNILDQTSAHAFGFCTALRSEGAFKQKNIFKFTMLEPNGDIRGGTMTDEHIRLLLKDEQPMKRRDAYPYGSSLFLSLWDEYAGQADEIKQGEPAADKFLELCANNIAHPHDIWPVLWELANDGKDSNEFTPTAGPINTTPKT